MAIPTGINIDLKILSMKKRGIPPATTNPMSSTALNVFYKLDILLSKRAPTILHDRADNTSIGYRFDLRSGTPQGVL